MSSERLGRHQSTMARITYVTYDFQPPRELNEMEYYRIKEELKRNPAFCFYDEAEDSITKKFYLRYWIYNALIMIVLWLLSKPLYELVEDTVLEAIWVIIAILGMLWFVVTVLWTISHIPTIVSYVFYIKEKRQYFTRLRYCIENTSSYQKFRADMYGYQ